MKYLVRWRVHSSAARASPTPRACEQRSLTSSRATRGARARRRPVGVPAASPMRCWRPDYAGRAASRPVDDAVLALRERHVGDGADARPRYIGRRLHGSPRRDCQDITRHSPRRAPDAFRVVCSARPGGRLWRDLVDASVRALSRGARDAAGRVQWVDARDVVRVEWSALGPSVQWDESRANAPQADAATTSTATLIITGFIARDRGRAADHARPERQRFLGVDLRRPARRRGDRTSGPTSTAC